MTPVIPAVYRPLFATMEHPGDKPPYRYLCYSGGRSSGKSTAEATALVLEGAARPLRILCTREFQTSIKESVKQLLEQCIAQYELPGYEIKQETIEHRNGTRIIFRGLHNEPESTIKGYESIDRCWVEEAQFISADSLDILLPTIRKPGSTLCFTWNPNTDHDPVMRRFVTETTDADRARTFYRHTTYRTLDEAGLLTDEVRAMIEADRGTARFDHTWEGAPVSDLDAAVITRALVAGAVTTEKPTGGIVLGADIARYGHDRSALARVHGGQLEDLEYWRHASIPDTARRIAEAAKRFSAVSVKVDDTGVGGGVTDLLREWKIPVTGINFAAKAREPDKYPNISSELWFSAAEKLDAGTLTIRKGLPHLADLAAELCNRQWHMDSRARRVVAAKSTLEGSPDLADAVLLAAYDPPKLPRWGVGV